MSISITGTTPSYWQIPKATAAASSAAKLTKAEAEYDTDGDGVLSATEKQAMYKTLATQKTSSYSASTANPVNDGGPHTAEAETAALATQTTRPTDGGGCGEFGRSNAGGFNALV